MMMGPPQSAPVRPDLTFELGGLFGSAVITVSGGPPNWIVESIRYRGQDITDIPIDFAAARQEDRVDITLTNRGVRLTGTVVDDSGRATAALIWILPADSVRWTVQSMIRRGSQSESEGGFKIGPVRPGEYLIVALDPEDAPRGLPDPKYFERVAALAERITLNELNERTVHLQLRRLQ